MKILRFFLQSVFVTANLVIIVLLIFSAFSDRISPEISMGFSYLGLLFPFLCLFNLGFVFYWIFLNDWKCLLMSLCAFAICWGPVRRYFPFHFKQEVHKEETLKVLTYNVMAFGYKNHTNEKPNEILRYIANSGADIVCLQEFYAAKSSSGLTARKIYKALKMYPYRSVFYLNRSKYHNLGLAVFSKYPIANSRRVDYKSAYNGSTVHEITIKGKKLTLINNHLESFKLTMKDRSKYSSFIKSLNPEEFDGLKGSVGQKLGSAFKIRAKQAEAVAREVKNAKGDYVLVCGDFNDTPISYAHRTIQGNLKDAFVASGQGMGVTYNQNFFWFRIDNILHSANMSSKNSTVDNVSYSDHYPLWTYFILN